MLGLHLTFSSWSSVPDEAWPCHPPGCPQPEPRAPSRANRKPQYLPQAEFGSNLIDYLGFGVFEELQAVLCTNLWRHYGEKVRSGLRAAAQLLSSRWAQGHQGGLGPLVKHLRPHNTQPQPPRLFPPQTTVRFQSRLGK